MSQYNLKVDAELRDWLPGVPQTTDGMLEESLLATGRALEPIVVWKKPRIIVDGHRRYGFCQKHGLPFEIREVEFKDRDAVKEWMDKHQLQRRNLTSHDHAIILARQLDREQKRIAMRKAAGDGGMERTGTKAVADAAGVSTRTVIRARKYSDALDSLSEDIRERVEEGRFNQGDVVRFAQQPETIQRAMLRDLDSGDFATLGEVMRGIGNDQADDEDDDATDVPSALAEQGDVDDEQRDIVSQLDEADLAPSPAAECPKGGDHDWVSDEFDDFCSKCKEPKPQAGPKESPKSNGSIETKKPQPKPMMDYVNVGNRNLGFLAKAIDELHDGSCNLPRFNKCRDAIKTIREAINEWKAEIERGS